MILGWAYLEANVRVFLRSGVDKFATLDPLEVAMLLEVLLSKTEPEAIEMICHELINKPKNDKDKEKVFNLAVETITNLITKGE